MVTRLENLFSGKETPAILLKPGHAPVIHAVGWGEPPTYHIECTCGWRGRTIESNVPEMLIAPLKDLANIYGDEAILGPNSVFGTGRSAVREVLAHLDLPFEELIGSTREEITKLSGNLGSADAWQFDASGKLQEKLAELDLLITVKVFTEVEPVAAREKPFDAAIYAESRRAIEVHYNRAPQTDAEIAEVLRDLGIDG